MLLRFLGLKDQPDERGDSSALARIEDELDHLAPDRARFFAAFAYVLARVASADLRIEEAERAEMGRILRGSVGLGEAEARLVAEIASAHVEDLGATDNYVVTRKFAELATRDEKLSLIRCLFAVAAADDTITGAESIEVMNVGTEIGLDREDVIGIRSGFRDKLAELRKLPGET
jgi:uncharacterized tellurite resistance protein B-like protein